MRKRLIVLSGPTGTGKTNLGIKLCQGFNGEIVSADSRQVYRGAEIGTNKRSKVGDRGAEIKKGKGYWAQDGVRIHLYDVVDPDERYTASRFGQDAAQIIQQLWRVNRLPFVVGGTGFYIAALLGDIKLSGVPARDELRTELSRNSLEQLQALLGTLNAPKLRELNPSERNNPQRLIRAIEIELSSRQGTSRDSTGGVFMKHIPEVEPQYHVGYGARRARFGAGMVAKGQVLKIGLTAAREVLDRRADRWTKEIVTDGLIEETQVLFDKGYESTTLLQGMIYRPTVAYIQGKIGTKIELTKQIQNELHAYVRRQLTWFKRDPEIIWFNISKVNFDIKVKKLVESFLSI